VAKGRHQDPPPKAPRRVSEPPRARKQAEKRTSRGIEAAARKEIERSQAPNTPTTGTVTKATRQPCSHGLLFHPHCTDNSG
jgi:hypothetical protein